MRGRRPGSLPVAASIAAVGAIYLLCLAALEPRGFWVVDNANKFLQLQAIADSGYRDYAIPWPGSAIDPELEWNPLPHPFSHVEDGRLYSFYPPFFATLSTLPYRWLGWHGLRVLPLLATLAGLLAAARLARALGSGEAGAHAAVWLAGLGTPLWFYALVFWEHALAVALAVFALLFAIRFGESGARRDVVLAGLAAAGSVWFRDELYLYCGVLGVAVLLLAPTRRFAAAAGFGAALVVGLAPLWLFQTWALGSPFGFHLSSQNASDLLAHLAGRSVVLHVLFQTFVPDRWTSVALSAPFLLGFALRPRLGPRSFAWALPVAALVGGLASSVSLVGMLGAESPIAWLMRTNGFFTVTPLLILAFVRPRERTGTPGDRADTVVGLVALAYAAVYVLAAPAEGSTGIHWGNRLVLVLYPLLAVLAAGNAVFWWRRHARARPLGALAVSAVVLLSVAAQAGSIALLGARRDYSRRLSEAIVARPEPVVVSDVWWVPQELFAVFAEKPIFRVASGADLARLETRLHAAGHGSWLFVTTAGSAVPGKRVAHVDDGPLHFFGVDFVQRDARSAARRPLPSAP